MNYNVGDRVTFAMAPIWAEDLKGQTGVVDTVLPSGVTMVNVGGTVYQLYPEEVDNLLIPAFRRKPVKRAFVVIENTAGYLPDMSDDLFEHDNIEDAKAELLDIVEQWKEMLYEQGLPEDVWVDPSGEYAETELNGLKQVVEIQEV